jgi:DNA-binding IclR family transcriptional regulator
MEPIAVSPAEAADVLGVSRSKFYTMRHQLQSCGLKKHKGRYLLDTLKVAFERLCDEGSGNVIRRKPRKTA